MKYIILFALSIATTQANDQILLKAASYVIKQNEGFRAKPYLCTNSHLTVGYGHKIINTSQAKSNYTKTEALELLKKDIQSKLKSCRRKLPRFDNYPVCVQVAILDGFFRGDLSGSPKAMKFMKQGEWTKASKEYLNHKGYRKSKLKKTGVYKRMDKNAKKFRVYGERNEKTPKFLS